MSMSNRLFLTAMMICFSVQAYATFNNVSFQSSQTQKAPVSNNTLTPDSSLKTNKLETINGTVIDFEPSANGNNSQNGNRLKLRTDSEEIEVILAPKWYMDQQEVKLGRGDTIQITGFRIGTNRTPLMLAAEVKRNGKALKLRDIHDGLPLWHGNPPAK